MDYLARSSFLLQQGHAVADVLYYYGDDTNIAALFSERGPDIPRGYNFDFANTDVMLNRLSVSDGQLVTASGMRYRVLVLDPNARLMQLSVLRRIREFVNAGAIVAGARPERSPRLLDDAAEFNAIVSELWTTSKGMHADGAGKVYVGTALSEVLATEKISPDFEHAMPQADTALLFVHRALADADIYWVNNRRQRTEVVETSFRVSGKAPELWDPETGRMEPASYRQQNGRTTVPLRLNADDAVFVVFRKTTNSPSRDVPSPVRAQLAALEGPWTVSFQGGRGAPATATFSALSSWSEHSDPGVKYFSGTATYTTPLDAPDAWLAKGGQVWLDLGQVKNLGQVTVNGKTFPALWRPPFRVNITPALKPGANHVAIAVTNLWVNRIIGDEQPGVTERITFTPSRFYSAGAQLLPSGLLGPVTVLRTNR